MTPSAALTYGSPVASVTGSEFAQDNATTDGFVDEIARQVPLSGGGVLVGAARTSRVAGRSPRSCGAGRAMARSRSKGGRRSGRKTGAGMDAFLATE